MPALRPMPALMVLLALTVEVSARDLDGRYANSPLKQWFETPGQQEGPVLCGCRRHGAVRGRLGSEGRPLPCLARWRLA
jgi:hypothetical protein